MAVFEILTRNGIADAGQEDLLASLAAELRKPDAKLLLHLHGGLVDEASGLAKAKRLSGAGPNAWNLGPEWTQVYVIWRTGALETLKTNWTDLARDDRLYQTILRKLIGFVARKLGVPADAARGPGSFALDEEDVRRRITGAQGARPFDSIDDFMAPHRLAGARATIMDDQSVGELGLEFEHELGDDREFQETSESIARAASVPAGARATALNDDAREGEALLKHLDSEIREEIDPEPATGAQARGIASTTTFLLKHAGAVAIRCFERFRGGRDHGLQATIVEEVCREFYGDLIGAKVWGMMVRDAYDHFAPDGLGAKLVEIVKAQKPKDFVVAGHSAGSIWAAQFLRAAKAAGCDGKLKLFLLAPAVRADLFAKALGEAGDLIECCRMIAMTDEAERKDALLGHDKSWIYPSSLLYVVSGMFEELAAKPYSDAPLVGMQRFFELAGFNDDERVAARRISTFLQGVNNGVVWSPTLGQAMAESHGAFDDEPQTLATVRALF